MKRRQRQGLPLYSSDLEPTTSTLPATTTTTQPTTSSTTKFDFYHQNQHPLYSFHARPTYSIHTPILDHSSLPSSSSPSLPFHQPSPSLHITPLCSKRYRTSMTLLDPPLATSLVSSVDGFNFPAQFNSSFSHIFQTPLESSSSSVPVVPPPCILSTKMELPSNQFSQFLIEPDIKLVMEMNDPALHTSNDLQGDLLLEAQASVSGQNLRKRSYSSLSEGNGIFDGGLGLDDLPLSSVYWSSLGNS